MSREPIKVIVRNDPTYDGGSIIIGIILFGLGIAFLGENLTGWSITLWFFTSVFLKIKNGARMIETFFSPIILVGVISIIYGIYKLNTN